MSDAGRPSGEGRVRRERDSLGELAVPADALWGAQTQRAVENFPMSGRPLPPAFLRALGLVKSTAAEVNGELGELPAEVADAIVAAAERIAGGEHLDQFPVDVFQTGSGTSSNMNANEVVARLASQASGLEVHPNDHVNRGQSSNDVIPTTLQLAAVLETRQTLLPALDHLSAVLQARADELAGVVKTGRTHLMDAMPVSLGREIGAWRTQVLGARQRIEAALDDLQQLAQGGTAVGTGINAHPEFADRFAAALSRRTGIAFASAPDKMASLAGQEGAAALSGALRTLAIARLMLDNFPHVKAFWIMQTLPMAQLMLEAGADDIDGTVVWYDITKVGGAGTHQETSVADLHRAIEEAGLVPVERDTLYRRVIRDGNAWRVEGQ